MLQYVIAGLAIGGIYAIASTGLVVTYLSAGVLNFAFGALAYFIARFYYFLNTQHGWNIAEAAIVSVVITGPALGVLLYFALFRLLRLSSALIKIVVTLGLSVTIAPISIILFGNPTILSAPGLAPEPVHVYHFLGVPVDLNKVISYIAVVLVMVIGTAVLRFTDVGLRVRAMVDSPAMTSLSGTNPTSVSVGVWAASVFLAGLAGVLFAPIIGLGSGDYFNLMAAAFAAVIAAKLRNLPVAVVVGLLMGIATALIPHYLPPSSTMTAALINSIPFIVTAVFLVYYLIRRGGIDEAAGIGGALDRAIAVQTEAQAGDDAVGMAMDSRGFKSYIPSVSLFAVVCIIPLLLSTFWQTQLALGCAAAVMFLAFSLVVGEGGMVWLCIASFGAIGAVSSAQFATNHHWPILLAIFAGGLISMVIGVLVGMLTIRLGDLYVALATLNFGLLMDNLVFTRNMFTNQGIGVSLNPPDFAHSPKALIYFALVVFALLAVFIVNLRRSTTGMALTAVRWSESASKTIGISVFQMKVIIAGLAAFAAAVGGAILAINQLGAQPTNFETDAGVIWLAVLVTQGIRSNIAALVAGISLYIIPALFQTYLASPHWLSQVPYVLFGLGAIMVARNPDGVVIMQARQLRALMARLLSSRPPNPPTTISISVEPANVEAGVAP
jgi:branched-chain amino acid transport system permease protein